MYRTRFLLPCLISICLLSGCDYFASDAARLQRAAQARDNGDYGLAGVQLRNVLQSHPEHADARRQLVDVLLLNGEAQAANTVGEQLWSAAATDSDIAQLRVRAELANGNAQKILEMLDANQLALSEAQRSLAVGQAQLELRNVGAAEEAFKNALADDENLIDARIGLAQVYAARDEIDRALGELGVASTADSPNARALRLRGMLLGSLGEPVAASAALDAARAHAHGRLTRIELITLLAASIEQQLASSNIAAAEATHKEMTKLDPAAVLTIFSGAQVASAKQDYAAVTTEMQSLLAKQAKFIPARMLLAKALYAQERWGQAEQQALQIVTEQPQHVEARMLLARLNLREQRPAKAIEFLAPGVGDKRPDFNALLADAYQAAIQADTALAELSDLVARKPSDEALRTAVAGAYLRAGQPDAALKLLRQETNSGALHPQRVQLILAAVATQSGGAAGVAAAQREAERIASSAPVDARTLTTIGRFFAQLRQGELARNWLQRAAEAQPDNASSQLEFAQIAHATGDRAGAERAAERVLRQNADNLPAHLLLAESAAKRGDFDKAFQYLATARAKYPRSPQPLIAVASFRLEKGMLAEAASDLRHARDLAADRAGLLTEIARLWLAANRPADAADTLTAATKLQPNNAQLWRGLAEVELAGGDADSARNAAQKAFDIQQDVGSLRILVQAYGKLDQAPAALKAARDFRAAHPQDIEAVVLEGDALVLARDYAAASELYDELLARLTASRSGTNRPIDPSDRTAIATGSLVAVKAAQARREGKLSEPNAPLLSWLKQHDVPIARLALADAYRADGNLSEAISNYQRVLSRSPDNITALNNLAVAYFEAKDSRALETARKAYGLTPNAAAVADTYGWILLHAGRTGDALPILKAAAAGQVPEIVYHYAAALARSGNKQEARALLEKILAAREDFSGKADARQLLKELQTGQG